MEEFNAKYNDRIKNVAHWNLLEEGNYREHPFDFYNRVGEKKFLERLEEAERIAYFQEMFYCMLVSVYGIFPESEGDENNLEKEYNLFKNVYNCNAHKYETEHVKKNLKPVRENNALPDWMYRI